MSTHQVHIQKSPFKWNYQSHSTPQLQPQTQLQFNLNPPTEGMIQYLPGKPRPIVIEKLMPYPAKLDVNVEPMISTSEIYLNLLFCRPSTCYVDVSM